MWHQAADRGPEAGSLWAVLDGLAGVGDRSAFLGAWAMVLVWTAAVVVLCRWAPETPRLSQVALLLVAGVAVLGVSYRPEQALWLLPLAALARPRWRDLLVWQAGEVLWLAMASWQQGGFLEPGGGGDDGFAYVAILVRVVTTLWLVAMVVRDVLSPERGPGTWCPARSAHDDAVEPRGRVAHPYLDLVADVRDPGSAGQEEHRGLHVRRLGEEALLAVDRERRAHEADGVETAAGDGGGPAPSTRRPSGPPGRCRGRCRR